MHFLHHGESENGHGRWYHIAGHIVMGLLLAVALALVFGYLVMLLWNATMPDIFAVREISYWQGVGLIFLARLLTGGFGHGHGHGRGWPGRFGHREGRQAWREYNEWWRAVGEESFRKYANEDKPGR
jgi:hypothetical protein